MLAGHGGQGPPNQRPPSIPSSSGSGHRGPFGCNVQTHQAAVAAEKWGALEAPESPTQLRPSWEALCLLSCHCSAISPGGEMLRGGGGVGGTLLGP